MPTADQITRQSIVDAARSFIGIPWVHQGRRPDAGLDCIGLLKVVGDRVGVNLEDCTAYSRQPDGVTLMRELGQRMEQKPTDQLLPGDLVVFWISNPQLPQHIAFFTHNSKFVGDEYIEDGVGLVHTMRSWENVCEAPIDKRWRKRMHAAFTLPGVID